MFAKLVASLFDCKFGSELFWLQVWSQACSVASSVAMFGHGFSREFVWSQVCLVASSFWLRVCLVASLFGCKFVCKFGCKLGREFVRSQIWLRVCLVAGLLGREFVWS